MSRLLYGLRTVRGTRRFWRFGETSLSSVRQRWLSKSTEEAVNNILFNPQAAEKYESFTLSALVMNEPGVLSRLSGILASRGFNIDSLVVCATELKDLSRMTIVLQGDPPTIKQAKRQLEDLTCVWAVIDYSNKIIVERDYLMVKVRTVEKNDSSESADASRLTNSSMLRRQSICELAKMFNAKVLDISLEHLMIELAAKSSRVDAFLELLRPFGIIESARSGAMAMARTAFPGLDAQRAERSRQRRQPSVDSTVLPPS